MDPRRSQEQHTNRIGLTLPVCVAVQLWLGSPEPYPGPEMVSVARVFRGTALLG
jgi:hypothetical protein